MRTLKENCFNRRVYISGPMKGIKKNNIPAFNDMEKALRKAGFKHVVNPGRLKATGKYKTEEDYLRKDIRDLSRCDIIIMMNGWQMSEGAMLEHYIAWKLKLKIICIPEASMVKIFKWNYLR